MSMTKSRLDREYRTIQAMIGLFCRHHHGTGQDLCPDCASLLAYARSRINRCPYQENKPACSRCPVHCYRPDMRTRIREVMRDAGPKMVRHHPWLAFRHLLDGLIKGKKGRAR
jgi:hypothetical protein